MFLSIILVLIGTFSWGATIYINLLRWKTKAQMLAEQDAIVLKTACSIVETSKSDVAGGKLQELRETLKVLWVKNISIEEKK